MKVAPTIVRRTLAGLGLLVAVLAFAGFRQWQASRAELVSLLEEAGLQEAVDRVRYERTPHHARVLVARALVYDVLDATAAAPLEPTGRTREGRLVTGSAEWEAAVGRLGAAAGLSRRVLASQPNNWQALLFLGASVYLERSIRRDRRLFTEPEAWEAPLRAALAEAPGAGEPRRFLAAAYLELWQALSPSKREVARELIRETFAADAEAFQQLVPAWLEVAGGRREAFSLIPDTASAWRYLEQLYAGRRDWEVFSDVHERHLRALLVDLERSLADAERRLRLGELYHSRSLLLQVVARSPRDSRFAPLVARAFERYPPGLHGLGSTDLLAEWLRWALRLHGVGKDLLPPLVISRLAGAAGEVEPSEAALAALVGGELHHAERLERMTESLGVEAWGPYVVAKVHHLVAAGELAEATELLGVTDSKTEESLGYARVRLELAHARGALVEVAEAERRLDEHRRRGWPATAWQAEGESAYLEVLPSGRAAGLAVALNRVRPNGTVVAFYWDGERIETHAVLADGEVELALPVHDGPHLLEVRMLAGERLFPGAVRLLDG